jgi:uncharacterized integral membrane protein (TIGR00698 family)
MDPSDDNAALATPSAIAPLRTAWIIPVVLAPLIFWGNPLAAILAGAALSLAINRTLVNDANRVGKLALQVAIVLLGFNLDAGNMWHVTQDYAGIIVTYVLLTFGAGIALGRILKVDRLLAVLIAAGTAICGGTAIATLGPILKARGDQIALALGIVFFLNMIALVGFPVVGHWLHMSQFQFGFWSAVAVHDTSSVVATAAVYGQEAAQVATTLKLGRTLWIIPLLLTFSLLTGAKGARIRIPAFIVLFVLASIVGSLARAHLSLPAFLFDSAQYTSKALIVVALFFIGLEVNRDTVRNLHGRVVWQALLLWAAVVPLTLLVALRYAH